MKPRKKLNTFLMTFMITASSYGLVGCGTEFNASSADSGVDNSEEIDESLGEDSAVLGSVFDGALNSNWETYDCCGGTTPVIVNDNTRGDVIEFTGAIDDANMGFTAINAIDISGFGNNSALTFDIKIIQFPTTTPNTDWTVKVQSNGGPFTTPAGEESSINVSFNDLPAVDEWKSFSFPVSDMENAGLIVTAIDKITISPSFGSVSGAVYYVDNVKFTDLVDDSVEQSVDQSVAEKIVDLTKDLTSTWEVWGADGVTSYFYEVVEDAEHQYRVRFEIDVEENTTAAFEIIDNTSDGIDVDAYKDTGIMSFDMKLRNDVAGVYTWNVRLYSGEQNTATSLNTNLDLTADSHEKASLIQDQWVHFSFSLSDFAAGSEIDMSSITQIRIYPAFGTKTVAEYDISNLIFYTKDVETE